MKKLTFFIICCLLSLCVSCFITQPVQGQTSSTYLYTFQNTGFDTGAINATDNILLSLAVINGSIVTTTITPNATYTWNLTVALVSASWNFSTAQQLTRTIDFLPADGTPNGQQTFQLKTASQEYIVASYVFSTVDYTGTAQYVEVRLGTVLVERKNIALSGSADFSLYKSLSYTITVLGIHGTFSQNFVPGNTYINNLIVLAGSFGEQDFNTTTNSFTALRNENSSSIIQLHFNSAPTPGHFNFTIIKKIGLTEHIIVANNVPGLYYPVTYAWYNAEENSDYTIKAYLYDENDTIIKWWILDVPQKISAANPWAALLAPFAQSVATLPGSTVLPTGFDIAQAPVAAFLFFVLAIFSWKNHGTGCLLCCTVGLVMVGLGWWVVSFPAFLVAIIAGGLIVFGEGKKQERLI